MLPLAIRWDVNPIIFNIGPFELRWYSLLFALGFIIGFYIMKKFFTREGVDHKHLDTLLLYVIIGTVVGARIGHCVFYDWDYYSQHLWEIILPVTFEPKFRFIGYRGLASHGGAIAILFMLWLFAKRVVKKRYLWVLDRVVIPIALAGMFIRLGNLMNSEIVGLQTDVPWAFIFTELDEIPRHPVQLYEAISYLITFAVLYWLYWKTDSRLFSGRIFGIFLVLLWGFRFIMEYFKRSQGGIENTLGDFLSTGQWLSIPFILVGSYLIWASGKKHEPAA